MTHTSATSYFTQPFHANNACPSAAVYKETEDAIWLGSWHNVNNNDFVASKFSAHYPTVSAYRAKWDKEARGRRSRFAPCPTDYMVTIDWANSWNSRVTTTKFDYSTPSKEWDAEAAAEAVKQQRHTFGDLRPGAEGKIRSCDVGLPVFTSNKKQIKSRELDRALSAAFAPRRHRFGEQLSLDTQQDYGWTPSYEDTTIEDQDTTGTTLRAIYEKLSARQIQVAELLIDGHTQREIAVILGCAQTGVSQIVSQIRTKLS